MMEDTILEVENLRTSFTTDAGSVQSVRGITFRVGIKQERTMGPNVTCIMRWRKKNMSFIPMIPILTDRKSVV